MIEKAINRLTIILDKVPNVLRGKNEAYMSEKPSPDKWSKKEILGHLIDSATNNHQRFVRGQFELNPDILYDQDKWNAHNYYQEIESSQIVDFWIIYNKQLLELVNRIPKDKLTRTLKIKEDLFTIEFLFVDYVDHLEHHLAQIIEY